MNPDLIQKPDWGDDLMELNGNTADIIKKVMWAADTPGIEDKVFDFAQYFKADSPEAQVKKLKELWKFCRSDIRYKEDPIGQQWIKAPARAYWDWRKRGKGTDCKSKSLFNYSICKSIGVKCSLEFVSFFSAWDWVDGKWMKTGKRVTHVFPVAYVPGYGEVILDSVHDKFNERPRGITKTIRKLPTGSQAAVAGIGGAGNQNGSLFKKLAFAAFGIWAIKTIFD